MHKLRSFTLLVAGYSLNICCPWASALGFQPVSQEELKMTSEPHAPGAPAIILFREVDRDDNPHTSHEDNYYRIKILTEEGRKYANIEIPFLKELGNIHSIRSRTIRPDGSIAGFDGKVFEKYIVKSKGFRVLAKTFTLPDVQVGSVIEYSYTLDFFEHWLYNSHWILSEELFTRDAKFTLKPYQSESDFYSLRWSWNYLPPGTTPPKEGPDKVLRMEAMNIPAFQSEDFMPPENELKSRVDFIYGEEHVDTDPDKFWKAVGRKRNSALESFLGKPKAMGSEVAQIVTTGDTPETKLRKIYARVEKIRNTSYEPPKTEEELKRSKEKPPASAEEVLKKGYGDGRQITWLFLALTRAAGIDAQGVWVSDRRGYFFNPRRMDPNSLNANVVQVQFDGKTIYLDPGYKFSPFGFVEWGETGVQGLKLDKDGGTWVQTPVPTAGESAIVRTADLKLMEDTGGLEGKLTVTYTGLEALSRRVDERNEDETARKTFLEDEVKSDIPAACEVTLSNQPDWDSWEPSLKAEFTLKVQGWASQAGHRALIRVGLFGANEQHVFDHTERVYPIYMEFPHERKDEVNIELPAGWQISSVPQPQKQGGAAVGYSLNVGKANGKLHLERTLDVRFLEIDPKNYTALRNFFHTVKAGDDEQIVLQPGPAVASN